MPRTSACGQAVPLPAGPVSGHDESGVQSPLLGTLPHRFGRHWGTAAAAVAVLGVFLVHFRPWQGGLLEDWGLALAYDADGVGGFVRLLPAMLGRPLHLLPHYLGMAMSGGGFVGPYAILGLVAVAQVAAALWAVRSLTDVAALRWAAALAIALHPWWAAGDILRFLPAQVSVLGAVLWLGASTRFLASGGARSGLILILAPIAGLLTYQAPAIALVIGSLVLALTTKAPWRRRMTVVGLTVGLSGAVMVWSVLLAPRLSPTSYENQVINPNIDLVGSMGTILKTLALHAPTTALAALLVGLLVVALGFDQRLSAGGAWVLLLGVASAPAAALVYASYAAHVTDPERIALPVGLVLWLVFCCALTGLSAGRVASALVATVVLTASLMSSVVDYGTWTAFATSQQGLLEAVNPVRDRLPHDAEVVLADHTGRFGENYLFLPPHLNIALDVQFGPGADFVLCRPDGLPQGNLPYCSGLLDHAAVASLGQLNTREGSFEMFEVEPNR